MNSLNSSLVNARDVEAVGPRVGSGALVRANEPRDKELSELVLLEVALPCVVPLVGVVRGLA